METTKDTASATEIQPPVTVKESDVLSNELVTFFLWPSYGYKNTIVEDVENGTALDLHEAKIEGTSPTKTTPPKGIALSTMEEPSVSVGNESETSFVSAIDELPLKRDKVWNLNAKGWVCIEKPGSLRKRFVVGLSRMLTSAPAEGKSDHLDERAGLFFSRGLHTSNVRVAVIGLAPYKRVEEPKKLEFEDILKLVEGKPLFPISTEGSGLFAATLELNQDVVEAWRDAADPAVFNHHKLEIIAYKSAGSHSGQYAFSTIDLIDEEGISLISDLDDTIKESDVHMGKRAAIKSAFFGDGIPVAGMSEAYQYFTSKGVGIHYVSASPYQLFPTILNFMVTNNFPLGSLNLRDFWAPGNMSSRAYKIGCITKLFEAFPKRKFILVGDSGEKDSETAATLYGSYPDHILKVFIRDVTLLGPGGSKKESADQRHANQLAYVKASLKGIPTDKWTLFESSEALLVDELIRLKIGETVEKDKSKPAEPPTPAPPPS
ncbi:hypothetical protein HDU97_004726 [Phlyctochytrium planicorne]|nr:hypothetical protein HDU97_004726 [Phlyctochytrium planicorne]